LKGLAIGDWRDLTQKELTTLLKSVEHSSSEAKPGTRKSRSPNRSKPSQSTHKKGQVNRTSHGEGKKPNVAGPKRNAAGKPIVRKPTTKHPDRGAKRGGAAKSGKPSVTGGRSKRR
jgi:23S rRNA pseudouridine2604 synthase